MANETRDRLVELVCGAIQTDGCIAHCNYAPCIRCEIIADHLIENGVIVPPCKVGDRVYSINAGDEKTLKICIEPIGGVTFTCLTSANPYFSPKKKPSRN